MEEQLISFETAKLAKDKGFNEDTELFFNSFYPKGTYNINGLTNYDEVTDKRDNFTSLPTQSLLQKWLREKHNIHIEIELTDNTMQFYYQYCIVDSKNRECHDEDMIDQATRIYNYNERFNTYEEAREQAILKAIEIVKQK